MLESGDPTASGAPPDMSKADERKVSSTTVRDVSYVISYVHYCTDMLNLYYALQAREKLSYTLSYKAPKNQETILTQAK